MFSSKVKILVKKSLRFVVLGAGAFVGTSVFVVSFVGQLAKGVGPSMSPTLPYENIMVVDKISPRLGWIQKGDIVGAECVFGEKRLFICKRVAGLEGDVVEAPWLWFWTKEVRVPPNHVWLLGDNAAVSFDSRAFGPVHQSSIYARAVCQVWPEWKWDIFHEGRNRRT